MKLLEQGWEAYRRGVIPSNASQTQINETRNGYYAGAYYLFASVMSLLSPGKDPSEADLQLLTDLDAELNAFVRSKLD